MLRVPAIRIEQPLGVFFAVSLRADFLLKVCYTIRTKFVNDTTEEYEHNKPKGMLQNLISLSKGSQREKDEDRVKEITRYTETVDAGFPNSIILGANYTEDGELISDPDSEDENDRIRWRVEQENGIFYLIIPSEQKLASIIDGQHRLFAFTESKNKDMELLCSVYLDLPMPYHAQIFATINMNQKKVDRNHIYQLFQFHLEQGESETWAPETLAVYFARVLSENKESPLYKKMRLGISDDNTTSISMASIIDGIMALITANPKDDRETLYSKKIGEGRTRELLQDKRSNSPLRDLYLTNKDRTIYDIIHNYFVAVDTTLWQDKSANYVFKRTLGVQALFDFLKEITKEKGIKFNYSIEFYEELLKPVSKINFEKDFFGIQTKLRSRLKSTLLLKSGLKTKEGIVNNYNETDLEYIINSLE